MIVTLAGRRIDAPGTNTPRFPSELAGSVKQRIVDCLVSLNASQLVCSAACGADLLALQAADEILIKKTIMLPFDAGTFRSTSVTDRPGDWGSIFDKAIEQLKGSGQIIELDYDKNDPLAYEKTNLHILDYAQTLALQYSTEHPVALIVWEGKPKDTEDTTYHFMEQAKKRGFGITEINISKG
ncbi:MAG: hypothetical protein H7122_08675 [Chitinophagaceae bacterium]|nr:hypothetical protein [Chitinophagaceae bacterium]